MKNSRLMILAGIFAATCGGVVPSNGADGTSERISRLEKAVTELQQENEDLKKQMGTTADSAAAKIKLSAPVQELRIYGDGRVRFAFNEGRVVEGVDHGQADRWRYRLRLGMDLKLNEGWFFGFQLQTGANARSTNVTMGGVPVFNKASTDSDNFVTAVDPATIKTTKAKAVTRVNFGDTVFVGLMYLRYTPRNWISLEGGRIPNPFIGGNTGASGGSLLVWDPDINPQGFAEHFKITLGPWGGTPAGYSKDGYSKEGKAILTPEPATGMTLDLFANFGQFVYEDVMENNFNKAPGPAGEVANHADLWMLGFQAGAKANFTKTIYFQVAPAFYTYTGGDVYANPFNGDATQVVLNSNAVPGLLTFNQTGINDLEMLEIPAEFGWTWWKTPFKIFGEYVDNLQSKERAREAGHPDKNEGTAYAVGAGVGAIKKKGDWELKGWWQHEEQFALDPNIIDDDIFDGKLNMEGYVLKLSYAFTDAAWFAATYAKGTRIDHSLGTGGGGGLLGAAGFPLDTAQLLFLDVNLKF